MYFPRGEFHTYRNAGSSSGRLLVIVSPPQFEKCFEEIGVPVDGPKSEFQPPAITPEVIENVVKTGLKYGIEIKLQ